MARPTVVFMGTPEFAVPSLKALHEAGFPVLAAVTQPDRPVGRGRKLMPTPVKAAAMELGIPVYQPERVSRAEGRAYLESLAPDLIVTAAFGQILSQRVLDIPKIGCLNVHASLLPKHRGSAPVNWCLICGDEETGVTVMEMDAGIDTGAMLVKRSIAILPEDTAETLTQRLSLLGAEMLPEAAQAYADGKLTAVAQNEAEMTYDPMLQKTDGLIDWRCTARQVADRVRGVDPWPGAYAPWQGEKLKIWKAVPTQGEGQPGQVLAADKRLVIACGEGAVELVTVQAPGGKRMAAADFLRGHAMEVGSIMPPADSEGDNT